MLVADGFLTRMALGARATLFYSVLASLEATDKAGHRLDVEESIAQILDLLAELRTRDGSVYLIGNGGSAAVASHSVTDFLNIGKLRAMTLHDSSLITCMANDYGYERAYAQILSVLARPGEVLFAVSSSGKSRNICEAVATVRDIGGTVITLSGFEAGNVLRRLGDVNIWLDSHDYGMVEIGHQFVLHNIADRLPQHQRLTSDVQR